MWKHNVLLSCSSSLQNVIYLRYTYYQYLTADWIEKMLFPNPDQQMEQIGLHWGIFTFRFTSKFQNSRAKIEEPFFGQIWDALLLFLLQFVIQFQKIVILNTQRTDKIVVSCIFLNIEGQILQFVRYYSSLVFYNYNLFYIVFTIKRVFPNSWVISPQ